MLSVRCSGFAFLSMVLVLLASSLEGASASPLLNRYQHRLKRIMEHDGNPCPDAEKPFPCKATPTCIPMGYLCDDSIDCEDGYDEDPEVCTAAHRPPVGDILNFLGSTHSWILSKLFSGRDATQVAHALVVSPTVEDYRKRLGLSEHDISSLKTALTAVSEGDETALTELGMPPSAYNEITFMFTKLIKSGFSA